MGKKIITSQKARLGILAGILEAGNTVAKTYGPRGRTVAYEKGNDFIATKDGISVLKSISFNDEIKNFGAMLLREASSKSNYISGDGSTGVAILTAELCNEANKLLNQGLDINSIKEGFRKARDIIIKNLETHKLLINDEKDIFNIAKISANNDEEIAKYITEAFTSIGDNGIVTIGVSQSRKGDTSVRLSSGIEFEKGFLSSKCVNTTNDQCILKDPRIVLSQDAIDSVDDIKMMTQICSQNNWPLIIIAPFFEDEVLAFFSEMLDEKQIIGSLINAPGSGKAIVEAKLSDLAIMLNAKVFGKDTSFSSMKEDSYGRCDEIIITKNKTTIVGAKTNERELEVHLQKLQAKINFDSTEKAYSEYEIEMIKERIAIMTGGIATILVGALTEIELNEKRDRYEDAVNAVRASINNGYIIGASTPLLLSATNAVVDVTDSPAIIMAMQSYYKAIKKPAKLLISSTGKDYDFIIPEIIKSGQYFGFNAKTEKIENLLKNGIIDPFIVIYNSIIYATNIAEQFVNLDAIIVNDNPNLSLQSLDNILNEDGIRFV